ncbi:MAG: carbohydrate binding family 9 domain-containing protein, partial [Phaeodactylibacter sp.]|nr:carbohydrate binding family 9 domain-containing protein [Phaeodactylibacter sp.]
MRKMTLLLLLLGLPCLLSAQKTTTAVQRQMTAQRTQNPLKIDGKLDEADWQRAPIADGFVQFSPQPGAASQQRSEVRVLYDNIALYVGARLYDTSPDSILTQMTERDELGVTDFFGVLIDAYQDGINGLGFVVTPKGIQYDTKYSAVSFGDGPSVIAQGDTNWDAVWDAAAEMDGEGWTVEIMIPYSAIRFPEKAIQTWNINFIRQIRRTREESFWNTVNPAMNGLMNQSGTISGLENIEAPIRLSATPFVVTYLENLHDAGGEPKNVWGRSFNAGMDIKYGLNDAFTLDMT